MRSGLRKLVLKAHTVDAGSRSVIMLFALLAGLLLFAPLVCATHLPFHDQMGVSHGICVLATTLIVGAVLAIPFMGLLTALPRGAYALSVPPLFDPISKPPQ